MGMSGGRKTDILMIRFPGAEATADRLARMVGTMPEAPRVQPIDPSGARASLRSSRIVWIVCPGGGRGEDFYELVDHVCQQEKPALLSAEGESRAAGVAYQQGIMLAPPDGAPATLAALVRGALSQAESVELLRHELAVTRRHHGGLRWQMDKLDEELRLAAQVQREFLPNKLPKIEGLEVGVMFRPSGYVGGDVYDVQRLDEHHVGLWIADVVGHGVPAALMTMFVKAALPTKEIGGGGYRIVPADESLGRLNHEMLSRELGSNWFVTACYAIINFRTRELQLASAGHPPAMRVRPDGTSETLHAEGPLLGVFEDEPFTALHTTLGDGDRLILHSDGFETAFAADVRTDPHRYRRELADLPREGAERAIAALARSVDSSPGSLHQTDDLTALIADMHPVAKPDKTATNTAAVGTSAI